jgi:imidazolonepropionase-like amidohydrolase
MRNLLPIVLASLTAPILAQSRKPFSPAVQPYVKYDAARTTLTHVRVIDGTGAPPREDQTIVIADGKIESISSSSTTAGPEQAGTIDLHGCSIIPGLVGMHDHLFYPTARAVFADMIFSFPRLYLACGVTTIRTTGSIEPYTDLELKRDIDSGASPGPKMHVTGPYLEGQGAWALQMHQLTGPEDATRTVNFWLDQGVDNFKAYNFLSPAVLSAAINAAHARGAKVTGHLCSIGFREAAALGIDDLEHGLVVDTEFYPGKKAGQCPQGPGVITGIANLDLQSAPVNEMIADLVEHKVAVTSTLPVFEMFVPGRPVVQQRVLDALCSDARNMFSANKHRTDDPSAQQQAYGKDGSPWTAAFAKEMEFEREFVAAGGLLLAGEDPTGMGGVLAGFGDQRELELLVEAGFTPLEAIAIATKNGAQYLGDLDRVGTITIGKQADLVVIRGDPSRKIEDIEKAETVFKDGVGYDSAKLIEAVRGTVGTR